MARKYSLDKLGGDEVKVPSKQDLAKAADLFGQLGEDFDDGSIDKLLAIKETKETEIVHIKISDIRDFGGDYGKHRFRYNEEEVEKIAESITVAGIITPLILRKDKTKVGVYECLAGHTRKAAALMVGLETVPAIIKAVSDEDAVFIMAATNKQRENILISEKAWIYRIEYEAMKRQTGRKSEAERNGGQVGHHFNGEPKAIDILAEKSEDSRKQIQRFIRVTYLIEPLVEMVDRGKIPFVAAVDISYLADREQEHVLTINFAERLKITNEIAKELKEKSKGSDNGLTVDDVLAVFKANQKKEDVVKEKAYKLPEEIFPSTVKKTERTNYIIKALEFIRENEVDLK